MKKLFLVLALVTCASLSFAQTTPAPQKMASEQDVRDLFAALHVDKLVSQSMQNAVAAITKMQDQMFSDPKLKLDSDDRAFIIATETEMISKTFDQQFIDEMLKANIPVYQKYVTADDVHALIAFYSSPVGQRFLAASNNMQKDAMEAIAPMMTSRLQWFMSEFTEKFQAYLQKKYGDKAPKLPKAS